MRRTASGLYVPEDAGRVVPASVRGYRLPALRGGIRGRFGGGAGLGEYGRGPNAPAWASTTVYGTELFEEDIPALYDSPNARGYLYTRGITGSYEGNVHVPEVVTYPTVSTPLGSKRVMRINYGGSTATIAANGEMTAEYPTNQNWSIQILGTWSGTLVFEHKLSGSETWNPFSMTWRAGAGSSGSSTTVNGTWSSGTPDNGSTGLYGGVVRVRASSWTSGSATVLLGVQGGGSPATMQAGTLAGGTKKFYSRFLLRIDPSWVDTTIGTKLLFWSQTQGNNHYLNLAEADNPGVMQVAVHMQGGTTQVLTGSPEEGPENGEWMDVEFLVESGTAGNADGTVKLWINDVAYINSTTATIFGGGTTPGFVRPFLDPTYGGGWSPPPANQYFEMAAWYQEGAP